MSGWLLGCCVGCTKRWGGADSLLQSCTTFQAEGNRWALVSATHRHPRRELSQTCGILQADRLLCCE